MIDDLPKRPRTVDFNARSFSIDEMRFLGSQTTLVTLGFKDCPIKDEHVRELRDLPRLLRLSLISTRITDAALEHVATLPKLEMLWLDGTKITGEGFRFLHQHGKLRTLWADETKVTDKTIALAAGIPKLNILRIAKTAVTFNGLLSLAINPRLNVVGDDQFTAEQMREFEATQLRLARESRGTPAANASDCEAAKLVLLAFFKAINEWEDQLHKADEAEEKSKSKKRSTEEFTVKCSAIFDKYCTPKPRADGRPNMISYCVPPKYTNVEIVELEQPTKNKVVVYTKDSHGFQRRYWIVKKKDEWRVDYVEWHSDGWSRDFL